jgi:tripartite ATP-independent transporter DctM subunit
MSIMGHVSYGIAATYVMGTIPLFMLMGEFLTMGGIGGEIFDFVHKWLGRLPGGLAIAAIGSCAIFAAMCGSSLATVVTIGTVAVPEMTKRGYDSKFAVGCVTSAGALGPLIPPSIILIIYGVMTEQSIGHLFIASIIPGVITMGFMMSQAIFMVWRRPEIAPKAKGYNWRERFSSLQKVWMPVILIFLVLGTIYMGVCTPGEAAAVGAFASFCIVLGRKRFNRVAFREALLRTARTASMIIFILVGARIFSYFLTVLEIPQDLTRALISSGLSPWIIIAGVQIIWLALGIFLDVASIVVVTSPLFVPALMALGFSPIWVGSTLVVNMAIAVVTPPMAMNLFVASATFKDVPLEKIIRGTLPFVLAELLALVVVVAFPVLSLWLPSMMLT